MIKRQPILCETEDPVESRPDIFSSVFAEEMQEIRKRRHVAQSTYGKVIRPESQADVDGVAPRNLCGLALSGGGIRAASFCLGVTQALRGLGLLRGFDYLSTVSGGGYLGAMWSAWLSRSSLRDRVAAIEIPEFSEVPPELISLQKITLDSRVLIFKGPMSNAEFDSLMQAIAGSADEAVLAAAIISLRDQSRDIFPRDATIEPLRQSGEPNKSLTSAGAAYDPLHHLRLFSNFLTPRKGILSTDTWRATVVVMRNLLFTWLILLPILFSVVVVAQIFYGPTPFGSDYLQKTSLIHSVSHRASVPIVDGAATQPTGIDATTDSGPSKKVAISTLRRQEKAKAIREYQAHLNLWQTAYDRLAVVAVWLIAPMVLLVLLAMIWLLCSSAHGAIEWATGVVGAIIVVYILYFLFAFGSSGSFQFHFPQSKDFWFYVPSLIWVIAGTYHVFTTFLLARRSSIDPTEVALSWLTNAMTRLVQIAVVVVVLLVLAGFGREIVQWCLARVEHRIATAGGLGATAIALITLVLKLAPAAGGDATAKETNSLPTRLLFAFAPPTVLIILLLVAAWGSAELLALCLQPAIQEHALIGLTIGVYCGMILCVAFAAFEMDWLEQTRKDNYRWRAALVATATTSFVWLASAHVQALPWEWSAIAVLGCLFQLFWSTLPLVLALVLVCLKADIFGERATDHTQGDRQRRASLGIFIAAVFFGILFWSITEGQIETWFEPFPTLVRFFIHGLISVLLLSVSWLAILFRQERSARAYARPSVLLAGVFALAIFQLCIFAFGRVGTTANRISLAGSWTAPAVLIQLTLCLAALPLLITIALGWIVDPNALSLHGYYRGRLVRAYLGASNPKRAERNAEITERIEGDDLRLADLLNCEHGAPYHLINTTLNLVGGRDLITQQRSSASFTLSKHFCGSQRTGFRRTSDPSGKSTQPAYMAGALTLGTAAAVSGAAASPNAGAHSPTAALAMLMTLFNIRLGFWAPNPSKPRWHTPFARLWPYYTLREFLSDTNDLQSYCYLSDGGHFDNTAAYSLVERACQYVILVDCGADPNPCFQDLGDLIRRCRIDFRAEIDLNLKGFERPNPKQRYCERHVVCGTITYDSAHLRTLYPGMSDDELDDRRDGIIVWVKPSLTGKDEPVDVRQYGLENNIFPQQTTLDQWFDESQFESYRQLGLTSILETLGKLESVRSIGGNPRPFCTDQVAKVFQEARAKFT